MSCGATSPFLQRVVPVQRLGAPSAVALVTASATARITKNHINFGSDSWRVAMCRMYRALRCLHRDHIRNDTQREFGDRFVAAEFRRGAKLGERQAVIFYRGWLDYGVKIERGAASEGRPLTPDEEGLLNEEQRENLTTFRRRVFEARSQPDVPGGASEPIR